MNKISVQRLQTYINENGLLAFYNVIEIEIYNTYNITNYKIIIITI